jgi:hypothetical protein
MHSGITISAVVLSLIALILSIVALYQARKESFAGADEEVDFYSYCVQQALDNNVLNPAYIPMACANQDAYILTAGVHGNQM